MLLRPTRVRAAATLLPLLALPLVACAPNQPSAEGNASPSASSSVDAETVNLACQPDKLKTLESGTLTVGTDSPAYEPWFSGNDPTNGKGYESAVAYAVAKQLGYARSDVTWVKVPFNNSYKPGPKSFDFDINQISITPEREKVVDFSTPYYFATQGLIALKGSPAAKATDVAELEDLKLGAQTGTTSLTSIREQVQPTTDPLVFEDTNAAKQALLNGQVDAIVADLPTAFYITAVEIPKATIVGQFEDPNNADQFGLLLEKGSPLTDCVDGAVQGLSDDGTIADLQQKWLSQTVDVPVLK